MMSATYIIYFSLIVFEMLLAHCDVRSKKAVSVYGIFLILLYSVVAGLKYSIGTDFQGYLLFYQNAYFGNEIGSHFEEGFILMNRILANLQIPPVFYFIFLNCINIASLYYLTKNIYPIALPFAVAIFIMIDNGFSLSTNIYRQYVAISLNCFLLPLLLKNRLKYFYILGCWLLASFHTSAWLCVIFFVLRDIKVVNNNNRILFIIMLALTYVFGPYIYSQVSSLFSLVSSLIGYEDKTYLTSGQYRIQQDPGLGVFLRFIQTSIIIYYYPKVSKFVNSKLFEIIFNAFLFASVIKALIVMDIAVVRTICYMTILEYLLMSVTICCILKSRPKHGDSALIFVVILIYVLLFCIAIDKSHNWMSPYVVFPSLIG